MMVYRKLLPIDGEAYTAHLLRLGPQDRHSRFSGMVSDEAIERHGRGIDWRATALIGCFVEGTLRGVVELHPESRRWSGRAELAVSVERPFQNRGIGTALVRRGLIVARNRCIGAVTIGCLTGNLRMQRIAYRHLADLVIDDETITGTVELPWPNQASLLEELMDDGRGMVGTVLDGWRQSGERGRAPAPA